jgi:predicted nucleic acid-binding protein
MNILIDTNVLLDILLKREPHFSGAYEALKKALDNNDACMISAAAITDIYYVLQKGLQDREKARESLAALLKLVNIADVTALDIQTALTLSMPDFEDAVVSSVAARYTADYIMTRYTKDFNDSPVPVITPEQFTRL